MLAAAAFLSLIAAAPVQHAAPIALAPPPTQDLTLPPETATTVTILEGRGVQIYTCVADGRQDRWLFKAPEAQLFNLATGTPAGHHNAGPSWTADDGTSIRGTVAADRPGATSADVPWLLLQVQGNDAGEGAPPSHPGVFAYVRYVRRYNTHGGVAPASGCDAAHLGQELRVPYTASYAFYSVPGAPSFLQQPPPPPPPPPPPTSAGAAPAR